MSDRRRWFAALLPVTIVLLFFDLGSRILSTNDETRFPMLARDILARGDWLRPRLNGAVYLNKPPLYAWLVALASWPGGVVTQTTAAVPSLIAATGVVLVTSWIAGRLFDRGTGFLAGLVAVTTYGVFTLARVPMPDMTLCLAFTAGMAAFVAAEFDGHRAARPLFYALVAAAFWTKGPAGLLPLAVVIVYAFVTHGPSGWRRLGSVGGILFLLLSLGSWWILGAGREAFDRDVVATDMLRWYLPFAGPGWRALTEPVGQTLTVVLPWAVLLPCAVWSGARSAGRERGRGQLLLLIWGAVVFLAIGVSAQQRMRYYLPLCPPLAALIAWWWTRLPFGRSRAVFAAVWVAVAGGLVAAQVLAGTRHNAATDLRDVSRILANAPAPLYAVEVPELVLAFYLGRPVVVLPDGTRRLEQYVEVARGGYVMIADRALGPDGGAASARRVGAGVVEGHHFSAFTLE